MSKGMILFRATPAMPVHEHGLLRSTALGIAWMKRAAHDPGTTAFAYD